jgi:hypothetical protein
MRRDSIYPATNGEQLRRSVPFSRVFYLPGPESCGLLSGFDMSVSAGSEPPSAAPRDGHTGNNNAKSAQRLS